MGQCTAVLSGRWPGQQPLQQTVPAPDMTHGGQPGGCHHCSAWRRQPAAYRTVTLPAERH